MRKRYGIGLLCEWLRSGRTGDCGFFHEAAEDFFGYKTASIVEFDYYGGRWILDYFVNVRLYWVSQSGPSLTYRSDWNYWRHDMASILYIMRNHPNLRERRAELDMDGKLHDRPRIIGHGHENVNYPQER